jgi:hypothetical protein
MLWGNFYLFMDTEETRYEDVHDIQQAQDGELISSGSGEAVMNLQAALMVNNFLAK